jgi:hypothetical protein
LALCNKVSTVSALATPAFCRIERHFDKGIARQIEYGYKKVRSESRAIKIPRQTQFPNALEFGALTARFFPFRPRKPRRQSALTGNIHAGFALNARPQPSFTSPAAP